MLDPPPEISIATRLWLIARAAVAHTATLGDNTEAGDRFALLFEKLFDASACPG